MNVDPTTGKANFFDNAKDGITRVVGIYIDPLVQEGIDNGGLLNNGEWAPVLSEYDSLRFIDLNGDGDTDDDGEDRYALNSQARFQNDLGIDNLTVKISGDFDGDGFQEVYWKTNDGTAYLRALMHADGNIQYANYQSEAQMSDYLTSNGYESVISEIVELNSAL